jgi:adenylate cyclase class 2
MPVETEKKYRLQAGDPEAIERRLSAAAGAEFKGEDHEENTIYTGAVLAEKNAVLRVRTVGDRTLLTYKFRLESGGDVKRQHEEETAVEDRAAIKAIIAELGMRPVLIYEKRRRSWQFRSVEIVLDELPFGLFMEIEGTVTAIREAELLLDLEALETEHKTYPMLTAELGERVGDVTEARFKE